MAEIQDGRYGSGLYKKCCAPICLDAPVHTQHKESMLCQTKGVSIWPHTFGLPICLDVPCMFGCPRMFGLTPCMFGCFKVKKNKMAEIQCPLYVWMSPYVWMGSQYVWML